MSRAREKGAMEQFLLKVLGIFWVLGWIGGLIMTIASLVTVVFGPAGWSLVCLAIAGACVAGAIGLGIIMVQMSQWFNRSAAPNRS